jgi:hypothetical protein
MEKESQEIVSSLNRLSVSTISEYTPLYAVWAKAWMSKAPF